MVFATSARTVTRVLIAAVLFLSFAGLAAKGLRWMWGDEGLLAFLSLFYVGKEAAIPTWYSSFALLLSSGLLATIAVAKRKQGDRYARHWLGLSIVFFLLSMDEVVQVHETLGGPEVQRFLSDTLGLDAGGLAHSLWVIPGAAMVLVFVLAYVRFLVGLPRQTRRLFLVGGTLFVVGALGFEALGGLVVSGNGGIGDWSSVGAVPKMLYATLTSIEEFLEMMGVVVFIYALLSYISTHMKGLTVRVGADD
jgi:hypothetical protein